MKLLWITNILFPEAERMLLGNGELKSTGGWLLGTASALVERKDIKLVVATTSTVASDLIKLEGKDITYYVLPFGKGNQKSNADYIPYWRKIKNDVCPDVVHIHGTEYSHGLAYLLACGSDRVVLSIQGLLCAISSYYCSGISLGDIFSNITFRDLVKGNILVQKRKFLKRAIYEKEMIRLCKHIIGRTSWDEARIWSINPNARYHFCNEILRDEFYDDNQWSYKKCKQNSIFLSQAGYPVKGLHQVLKAMPIIQLHYPNVQIRIAGRDITKSNSFFSKIKLSGYGLYIKRLIHRYHLEEKVCFIGNLNGEEMKREYLNANVFVCPSSVENSPNSLGEAQILGVPCIASYSGGIPDMMTLNPDNLYRFEEVEMLAKKICNVFANEGNQSNMRVSALERHNRSKNCERLLSIYDEIISEYE